MGVIWDHLVPYHIAICPTFVPSVGLLPRSFCCPPTIFESPIPPEAEPSLLFQLTLKPRLYLSKDSMVAFHLLDSLQLNSPRPSTGQPSLRHLILFRLLLLLGPFKKSRFHRIFAPSLRPSAMALPVPSVMDRSRTSLGPRPSPSLMPMHACSILGLNLVPGPPMTKVPIAAS